MKGASLYLSPPLKPAEFSEQSFIRAIIDDSFPVNSFLPPERELAAQLGVTRPNSREALQRMARGDWLEIHLGKATHVKDYWKEGNLNVLFSLSAISGYLPEHFIVHLLQIRALLCPTYTRLAVLRNSTGLVDFLISPPPFQDSPATFSTFDVALHAKLTILSGNLVFALILNGLHELIDIQSQAYFVPGVTPVSSNQFYDELCGAAFAYDPQSDYDIAEQVMQDCIQHWKNYVNK